MMVPVRSIEIGREIADSFGKVNKIEITLGATSKMTITKRAIEEVVDIGPNAFWEIKELLGLESAKNINICIEPRQTVLVTTTRSVGKVDAISILKTIQQHRKDKI